ncbi:MAG: hypothetical protein GX211_09205 [Clostridiaceae bacterium]|nr:hypothetical protein [Clostridiaceae bacterium]
MEDIASLIHRKKQLLYDINCIREYMETWESNSYLQNLCEHMRKEVEEINRKIEECCTPPYEDFEKQRSELLKRIHDYEKELQACRRKLREIDDVMVTLSVKYEKTIIMK